MKQEKYMHMTVCQIMLFLQFPEFDHCVFGYIRDSPFYKNYLRVKSHNSAAYSQFSKINDKNVYVVLYM